MKSGLLSFNVPSLDELLDKRPEHYPYHKSWAEAWNDPILLTHTSGSTGQTLEG